jgi:hypothetical protein
VAIKGPITKTKWSHIPITFSAKDINLTSFPHTDAMVVIVHIDRWDVTRILINNSSQDEILFLSTLEKMGYDQKQLKEPSKPLYGFYGKRIEPVSVIILPVSFGTTQNQRTEYITFNVIDLHYPYNAIFGRGLLIKFDVVLHSGYLCLKVSATFRVISVFGSQKDVKNIEQDFVYSHKNVHFVREKFEQYQQPSYPNKEALAEFKKVIKADGDFKKVALDPRVSDKIVSFGIKTSPEEQAELLAFLDKNNNVFT